MVDHRFDQLEQVLDELLAIDPVDTADDDLHEIVVAVQRQSHRLAAVRARLISSWEQRGIWSSDGSRSPGHRLARETSTSVAAGKTEVRRATALRSMPATTTALAEGALSPQHVDLLSGANMDRRRSLFEAHEELLVDQCRKLRFADATRAVSYWMQRADAEETEDEGDRLHESRGASAATTLDGMVDLRALLDPVGGATFLDELVRLTEQLRLQDVADGVVRTVTQRRADALVEMARRSRAASEGGPQPRPLVTVLVGEETLARICELATGTVVAPGQVIPLLSDADLERIVFDGPDRVMSVSRKRRFTGALRRAIEVRDRRCQHPSGCDEPATRCDIDHVRPWIEGGETSQQNGRLYCWRHNRDALFRNAQPPDEHDDADEEPETDNGPPGCAEAPDEPDGRSPPAAA